MARLSATIKASLKNDETGSPVWPQAPFSIPDSDRVGVTRGLLEAHHLRLPLWRILGGHRKSIPAYASTPAYASIDEYLDLTRRAQAIGYKAIKFHMNCDPAFDLEMVEAVAAEFGASGMHFMVDLEQCYALDDAVRLGRRRSELSFDWMEAPLDDADLDV